MWVLVIPSWRKTILLRLGDIVISWEMMQSRLKRPKFDQVFPLVVSTDLTALQRPEELRIMLYKDLRSRVCVVNIGFPCLNILKKAVGVLQKSATVFLYLFDSVPGFNNPLFSIRNV